MERPDLGDDDDLPAAVVRLAGQIGEPLIVIEAAVLTPDAAIEYAKADLRERRRSLPAKPSRRGRTLLSRSPERAHSPERRYNIIEGPAPPPSRWPVAQCVEVTRPTDFLMFEQRPDHRSVAAVWQLVYFQKSQLVRPAASTLISGQALKQNVPGMMVAKSGAAAAPAPRN
jgi:hypothetical protein